jgi:hypothetical protein
MKIYADKLPEEIHEDLKTVILRVKQNRLRAKTEDIKYLFAIYHEYLAPYDNQNVDCRACRAKVCGIFFSILNEWTE